jgi:hypothetical protein
MQGRKTHEQQLRILERKPDIDGPAEPPSHKEPKRDARQSEFAVSRGGMHQESQHNKHNDPGQSGHKPQKPVEDE